MHAGLWCCGLRRCSQWELPGTKSWQCRPVLEAKVGRPRQQMQRPRRPWCGVPARPGAFEVAHMAESGGISTRHGRGWQGSSSLLFQTGHFPSTLSHRPSVHGPTVAAGAEVSTRPRPLLRRRRACPASERPPANMPAPSATVERSEAADQDEPMEGITFGGDRFRIPETDDVLSHLFDPRRMAPPHVFIWAIFLAELYAANAGLLSAHGFVVVTLFWRVCYNGLLGVVLHQQSKTSFITRWVERVTQGSTSRAVLRRLLGFGMGKDYSFDSVPPAYNAWLLFRHLVDMILVQDVLSFW